MTFGYDRTEHAFPALYQILFHFDTTTVATPLPIRFVTARASDMKRSTPIKGQSPQQESSGMLLMSLLV